MLVVIVLVAVVTVVVPEVDNHLCAAGLLVRFEGSATDGIPEFLASYRSARVVTRDESYPGGRMRLYIPDGEDEGRPALVLIHGVHPRGIDERRFVRFADAIAQAGVLVATPELPRLMRFDLSPAVIEQIRESSRVLAKRVQTPVGVIGISFAGGLALLAATDPDVPIDFVVSVGGHHDLTRVVRWYLGDPMVGPAGEVLDVTPHPYGIGVFLYAHASTLFIEADVAGARAVLGELLAGRRDAALQLRAEVSFSAAGSAQMDVIFGYLAGDTKSPAVQRLAARVRELLEKEKERLAVVSPSGRLSQLTRDVFLIHGAGDPIVASTESRWLAEELPRDRLRTLLITDVMRHAEYDRPPSLKERWAMVTAMANILDAAR